MSFFDLRLSLRYGSLCCFRVGIARLVILVEKIQMNTYKYEDLKIGQKESFSCMVTEDMLDSFCSLTGDVNPLHTDSDFALSQGFQGRVAYGMLSASLFSRLSGVFLPGKYCLIQQVEAKFVNPVYIGDVLEVVGTVSELNDSVQRAVIKVEIHNQKKEKVVRGKIFVGFLEA